MKLNPLSTRCVSLPVCHIPVWHMSLSIICTHQTSNVDLGNVMGSSKEVFRDCKLCLVWNSGDSSPASSAGFVRIPFGFKRLNTIPNLSWQSMTNYSQVVLWTLHASWPAWLFTRCSPQPCLHEIYTPHRRKFACINCTAYQLCLIISTNILPLFH
jgi:hypothetical protein